MSLEVVCVAVGFEVVEFMEVVGRQSGRVYGQE